MTRHISIKELRPNLPKIMDAVDKRLDRYVVTKRGKPVAVVLSPDDFEGLLETLDILEDKAGLKRLRKAKRELSEGKTRSLDEIRRSLGRA
ncbi:type II toxin-antitoxin system Phd/YefM family antitoxin [Elusimicrobiota bacterium]